MNDFIRTQAEAVLVVLVLLKAFDLIDWPWWAVIGVPTVGSLCCGMVALFVLKRFAQWKS